MTGAWRLAVLAACVFVATMVLGSSAAVACPRRNSATGAFGVVQLGWNRNGQPDQFYNYDFPTNTYACSLDVEWPVDLIFDNDASVAAIYHIMSEPPETNFVFGAPFASTAWEKINVGSGFKWVGDGGRKTQLASPGDCDYHYRVYGADGQRGFSVQYGYFVIGTIHEDCNEYPGSSTPTYGFNENAERFFAQEAAKVFPCVSYDGFSSGLHNSDYADEGDVPPDYGAEHTFENDGLPTLIDVGAGGNYPC